VEHTASFTFLETSFDNQYLEMAFDSEFETGEDNPLRQVLINTHSPKLIKTVPEDSLYLACEKEKYDEALKQKVRYTSFSVLPLTIKAGERFKFPTSSLNEMQAYLDNGEEYIRENVMNMSKRDKKNRANYTVQDNIREQLIPFIS
jgi:hypothetical protein